MATDSKEEIDLDAGKQQAILDLFSRLDSLDHYEVLGVDRNADKKALKNAYYRLANEYHPDRHFRKRLGSFKAKLEAIFKRITQAHDVLTSDARLAYDLELTLGQVSTSASPKAPPVAAPSSPPQARIPTPTGPIQPPPAPANSRGTGPIAPVPSTARQTGGTTTGETPKTGPITPPARGTGPIPAPAVSGVVVRTPTGPITPPVVSSPQVATTPPAVTPLSALIPAPPPPRPAASSAPNLQPMAPVATPRPSAVTPAPSAATPTPGAATPAPRAPARQLTEEEIRARKRALAMKLGVRPGPATALPDADSEEGKFQRAMNMINDALARGDKPAAVRALKVATLLRPDDLTLKQNLDALSAEQLQQEVSQLWDSGIKSSQQGAWPDAYRDLSRAVSIAGKLASPQLLNAAAYAGLKVGGPNELHAASSFSRAAVELDPYCQEYRLTLVEVYAAAGLGLNVRRELEAAAKLDPTSIKLRATMEKLGIK
ncbi:MAG: DnaJ domain-containing protein [Polyangiaceae bacterium]